MSKQFEDLKKKYFVEHEYFNRVYVDDAEEKLINQMNYKTRKEYLKEQSIYRDTDTLSANCFRNELWDITNDEFPLILQMESVSKINKINSILNVFFVFWIIGIFLAILSFMR